MTWGIQKWSVNAMEARNHFFAGHGGRSHTACISTRRLTHCCPSPQLQHRFSTVCFEFFVLYAHACNPSTLLQGQPGPHETVSQKGKKEKEPVRLLLKSPHKWTVEVSELLCQACVQSEAHIGTAPWSQASLPRNSLMHAAARPCARGVKSLE